VSREGYSKRAGPQKLTVNIRRHHACFERAATQAAENAS
jgi:hypothetical protein